mmetsp:Transcript_31925/g.67917  ORF Transcript_31925/g.67917 Transcript_31925/m.67917 type:complete len:343 (-) Transcript_31925:253-1281(-)
MPTFAAVEGGGTTFVAAIATGTPPRIVERAQWSTGLNPSDTLDEVAAWLKGRSYDALGVACFGPLDMKEGSPTWGYITTAPKPGWQNTDVMGPLRAARPGVPCGFDTDVNAPALEEFRHYARPGQTSCAYITVGTGIGVGLVINGRSVRGLMHPEGGCMPGLKKEGDAFAGLPTKPHPWSIESLACSESIAKRAGVKPSELEDLPDDHEVWSQVGYLLGGLCASLIAMCSVERIVLSGGVMQRLSLFPKIRKATQEILNGYIQLPQIVDSGPDGIDGYIVPSERGNDAGIYGAIALAVGALEEVSEKKDRSRSWDSNRCGITCGACALVGILLAMRVLVVRR